MDDDQEFESMSALRYRIFGAQRDLIERFGGYKRVVDKTGKSKSEVGRWNGGADQDFMPPLVVAMLERECGYAPVTAVMADFSGRRLTDPEVERQAQHGLLSSHAEGMRRDAEYHSEFATALMDGDVSPSEAVILDRKLAARERAIADQRSALAVIKARGGVDLKLVER